jgi:hypothetical protein
MSRHAAVAASAGKSAGEWKETAAESCVRELTHSVIKQYRQITDYLPAIRSPGPGVVNLATRLFTPSLVPSLPVEVTA